MGIPSWNLGFRDAAANFPGGFSRLSHWMEQGKSRGRNDSQDFPSLQGAAKGSQNYGIVEDEKHLWGYQMGAPVRDGAAGSPWRGG